MTSVKVDKIIFTGSTEKGKLVAKAAAQNLTPCVLELGGKSPCIIDKSANVKFAAEKMAFFAFFNSGQTCIRPDYVLLENSLMTKFLEHLEAALELYYKNGEVKDILGKVINDFHNDRLCALMKDHGGTVVCGNANAHNDKKLTPTVIMNPLEDSPLMKEEIFGPILPIRTYRSIDEAIQFITARDKPLAIYFYGNKNS
jgi:aldehyde dehydrogenase (NAD+)